MKKGLFLLAVLGLAAMWVGCKKTEPTKPSPPKEAAQVTSPASETPAARPGIDCVDAGETQSAQHDVRGLCRLGPRRLGKN